MAVYFHIAPDSRNPAAFVDQKCCAKNPKERLAIHGFFAPRAVGLQHLVRLIRDQGNRKLMLVPKGFLRLQWIGRYTQHGGLAGGEGAGQAREVDGFLGAARRVGARVEKEYEVFSEIRSE